MERVTEPLLYDQFNRPLKAAEVKRPETRQVAVAALRDRYSSYPTAGLTPERLAEIFRLADQGDVSAQAELFEEIECDPHIGSVLGTRKNAVLGLDLTISPASESAEDKKISEFVNNEIDGLNAFDETQLDLLDAIGKGYSLTEIDWRIANDQATIAALRWLHPKRVTFVKLVADQWQPDDLTPRLLTEHNEIEGEEIPPFKALYHRYKARSGYDTKSGVLRVVAWMYLFKNYALKDWVIFSEVFGMPLRLGKYSSGASTDDRDALMRAVQSLGSDAAGIISKSTEIEFIHAIKAGGEPPYKILCEWADRQCSKAILGQTLTTETDGKGSYAAGKVHNDVRGDLLEADARSLARTLRDQLVRPLVGFNFGWDKPLPKVELPLVETEDLKELAEVAGILSEKIGYPFTLEQISERFKWRTPQKGETILGPVGSRQSAVGSETAKSGESLALKAEGLAPETVDPVVLAGDRLAVHAQTSEDRWLNQIKGLLEEVESLEEFRDRIVDLYADLDPAELGEAIAEALTLADLAGRFEVIDGS